jgi:hypothetical protein
MLEGEIPSSGFVQSGARKEKGFLCKSTRGIRTKAMMAIRVKSSSGSFNARWRRESGRSDTDQPA